MPITITADTLSKPHVAFLPSPRNGHITPLFELARRLVTQHNIEVTFFVITTGATGAQNSYFNAFKPHPNLHLHHLPPADMSPFPLLAGMTPLARLSTVVRKSIRPLRSILPAMKNLKAFIVDIFCTDAFDPCKELFIPVYSFFTGPAALMALSLYLPTMDREVEGEFVDLLEPVKVPGCHPIRTKDLLDQIRDRKVDEYKWFLFHVGRLSMAAGVFVNGWDDLEPVTVKAALTKPIEPVLDRRDKEIMAWLDVQPKDSVLFIALGSGGTVTSEQLTELARDLELSQQRFVLVVRKPSDSPHAAFFNAGSDSDDPKTYLPEGLVERTNGVGLTVCSWAPQVAVLNHGSTGAFMSHCGWNSTLESIKHGVPMIGWPMYAEQRMNASMLSDEIGVAVKMGVVGEGGETVVVGRDEIAKVVRNVMEGEEGKKIRKRARELEASGKVALSCGGSSYESLARVIESWKSET
ncbi:hypothetical protein OSB04_003136 [Centaurea solstitialis]|uniref:Glycosyltransferase n=1 Tax=Centaurea solstitialis TaxID=347529 RepID=A0AA38WTL0_9ASTR|nr:hypothetical protein OSB04_003136 [Centaurea solstitialis]